MNRRQFTKLLAGAGLLLAGCRAGAAPSSSTPERKDSCETTTQTYTRTTPIKTVRNDPVFGDYGRLISPVERSYYSGDTLEQLHLTYYNNIDPDETADICNTLRQRAADGQTIFYDIYTEDAKAADPEKLTPAYSTSRVIPAQNFPSATQAVRLRMWGPCRTAFLMHWNFPARSTTLLRSSTAPAHRPPAKIWHVPLPLSLPMRRNWK